MYHTDPHLPGEKNKDCDAGKVDPLHPEDHFRK